MAGTPLELFVHMAEAMATMGSSYRNIKQLKPEECDDECTKFHKLDNLGIVSAILSVLSLHYYNNTFQPFLLNLLKHGGIKKLLGGEDEVDKDEIIKHVNQESSKFVIAAYKGGKIVKSKNLKLYAENNKGDGLPSDVEWGYVKTVRNVNCYVIRYGKQLFVVIRNLNDNGGWGGVGGMVGGVMNKFHLQSIDDYREKRHRDVRKGIEGQYIKLQEYNLPLVHHGYLHMLFGRKKTNDGYHTYASDKILEMMNKISGNGNKIDKIIFSGQSAGAALLYMITYQLFKNDVYKTNFGNKESHVVTWNSTKPGNTTFSNYWNNKAAEAGVKTHKPYFTNLAVEPCLPIQARSTGLSRIYTPVKGYDDPANKKITKTHGFIEKVLADNRKFRSSSTMGDGAIWFMKKKTLKDFGIRTIPTYKQSKKNRKDIGDETKSGMISSQFAGSSQLGNIIVYKTWKIFYSTHCARKRGTSGYCTEIFQSNNDVDNSTPTSNPMLTEVTDSPIDSAHQPPTAAPTEIPSNEDILKHMPPKDAQEARRRHRRYIAKQKFLPVGGKKKTKKRRKSITQKKNKKKRIKSIRKKEKRKKKKTRGKRK